MYARVQHQHLHDLSDGELVRWLKLGEDEALTVLLRRHTDALHRYCRHLASSREDAEDICQEAIARALTRVDTLQVGSAFRSWLFSIARNLAIDSFRTQRRICPLPEEDDAPIFLYDDNPHDRIEAVEEQVTVTEALSKLAQSHQRVLMLREVDQLSYAEIASELDVSQSAVETLLFRARRRLKEEYSKSGGVPGLALLGALRGLAMRVVPLSGAPVAKGVLVAAAVVGGTAIATHRPAATPSSTQLAARSQHSITHVQTGSVTRATRPLPIEHAASPVRTEQVSLPARHSTVTQTRRPVMPSRWAETAHHALGRFTPRLHTAMRRSRSGWAAPPVRTLRESSPAAKRVRERRSASASAPRWAHVTSKTPAVASWKLHVLLSHPETPSMSPSHPSVGPSHTAGRIRTVGRVREHVPRSAPAAVRSRHVGTVSHADTHGLSTARSSTGPNGSAPRGTTVHGTPVRHHLPTVPATADHVAAPALGTTAHGSTRGAHPTERRVVSPVAPVSATPVTPLAQPTNRTTGQKSPVQAGGSAKVPTGDAKPASNGVGKGSNAGPTVPVSSSAPATTAVTPGTASAATPVSPTKQQGKSTKGP